MDKYIAVNCGRATYEIAIPEIAGHYHRQIIAASPEMSEQDVVAKVIEDLSDRAKLIAFIQTLSWPSISAAARMIAWQDVIPDLATAGYSEQYRDSLEAPPPADASIGRMPVDYLMSLMWQAGVPLFINIITMDGAPRAAIMMVRGDKDAIEAHVAVAAQLSEQMAEKPEGAPSPPRKPYNH